MIPIGLFRSPMNEAGLLNIRSRKATYTFQYYFLEYFHEKKYGIVFSSCTVRNKMMKYIPHLYSLFLSSICKNVNSCR